MVLEQVALSSAGEPTSRPAAIGLFLGSLPPRAFPSPVHAGAASVGRPRGQPGRGSAGPGVTRRRVATGAGGVAGARNPVPLPSVSWRAPGLSPPLRHSVGRRDTLPFSSMARQRPATGAGDAVCGREESRPRGPLPSLDRRRPAPEARGAAPRGPSFLSETQRQPAAGAARRGAGRGARARVGQWGRLGMPLAVRGRIDG
ncbi:hypothetical protein PVAP13_4NG211820 [Panicum virgatum]|uniref:Uncharacterized protein n=1 Tax=Panicum virgatum TaxID=38727 RepID=A0A8T0T5V2_PANVG|nr:hypothetical protein PVAP13_4NG211820 [Panicum virgatum]